MDKYRVIVCPDTGKEIVQVLEKTPNRWLCLHKDTPELDAVSVDAFKAGQNFSYN